MPAPAKNGQLVGTKLGKYELLALIAVGGTAEIYLARISGASGFEKYLVVKCLLANLADDDEFVRMFLDEARVSAQLDHSNIVQTLELGEQNGQYFLVMEYLAGMSLAQLARTTQQKKINGGLIGTDRVLGLCAQACNGLQYAHNKTVQGKSLNLVHRDISPQNLVVCYEGILKVVDFGIAKSSIKEVHTQIGTIKGKFAYMSPEQCLAKELDHRTDIFALGTLCHELLTGRRLFKRKNTYDTYHAIVNGKVAPPSKLNPELGPDVDAVVLKALAYKAEDRYQSAREFGEALLGLIHARGGSAGTADIARFFDDYFADELAEHTAKMRELITGDKPKDVETSWDSDIPGATPTPARLSPARLSPGGRQSSRKLSSTLPPVGAARGPGPITKANPQLAPSRATPAKSARAGGLFPEAPDLNIDAGDDEGPTRIEFNPADRIVAEHEGAAAAPNDQWEIPTNLTPAPARPAARDATRPVGELPRQHSPRSRTANPVAATRPTSERPTAGRPAVGLPAAQPPGPPPPGRSPRARVTASVPMPPQRQAMHNPPQSGTGLPPAPGMQPSQAPPSAQQKRKPDFAAPPETMVASELPSIGPQHAGRSRGSVGNATLMGRQESRRPPGLAGAPLAGAPLAGAPLAGAPLAGAPLAGAPLAGAPLAGASPLSLPGQPGSMPGGMSQAPAGQQQLGSPPAGYAALAMPPVASLPATATVAKLQAGASEEATPLWLHIAVFAAFVALGFGASALLKMFL